MDLEATPEAAEYSPQHGRGSPGSSMSSGPQDQSEAYDKGKGKGEQVTAESLHAAGFSSFISAGSASSSSPYSRAEERGPGLPSGPQNQRKGAGKGRRKGKGKAKGKDKGWGMSLAMPVREKAKEKQFHHGGKTT